MYDDGRSGDTSSPLTTVTIRGEAGGVKALKRSMTLDLNSSFGKPSAKRTKLCAVSGTTVLASPDLNMLKLASPELERMIIQQNGMVTTTPTPTQFICPKYVTEEQEAYARGFVDALEELHRKEVPGTSKDATNAEQITIKDSTTHTLAVLQPRRALPGISTVARANTNGHTGNTQEMYQVTMVNGYPAYSVPQSSSAVTAVSHPRVPQYTTVTNSNIIGMNPMLSHVKEEPQTVPGTPPPPAPSVSPIDMESQEVHKVERKRARNRIAARKCRHRKLERISRLEEKVAQIKSHNAELSDTATKLREQVCALKAQILDHVKNGCQVLMSQNLTF